MLFGILSPLHILFPHCPFRNRQIDVKMSIRRPSPIQRMRFGSGAHTTGMGSANQLFHVFHDY